MWLRLLLYALTILCFPHFLLLEREDRIRFFLLSRTSDQISRDLLGLSLLCLWEEPSWEFRWKLDHRCRRIYNRSSESYTKKNWITIDYFFYIRLWLVNFLRRKAHYFHCKRLIRQRKHIRMAIVDAVNVMRGLQWTVAIVDEVVRVRNWPITVNYCHVK